MLDCLQDGGDWKPVVDPGNPIASPAYATIDVGPRWTASAAAGDTNHGDADPRPGL